jgi:hypothetical protein
MKPQLPDAASAILRQALLSDGVLGLYLDNANADDDPVIFISTDPQWAQIALVMQNNTTAQMSFLPSTCIELDIWPLLTDDEIKTITVVGSDWHVETATGRDTHLYLTVRPVRALPLAAGQTMAIQFDHVLASGEPGRGRILVNYTGVHGVNDGSVRLPAIRRLPPDQPDNWVPVLQFASRDDYGGPADLGRAIYTTPWAVTPTKPAIANTFVLEIGTSVDLSFDSKMPPCLTISFLTGESDTSLCSDAEIEVAIVDINEQPSASSPWMVTKDPNSNLPSFNVTPCPETTTFVVGASIGVQFSNIATVLPSGKSSPVLIEYSGIPESNNGLAVVLLDKVDPVPFLRLFAPYVGDIVVAQGETIDFVPVKLKWDVFAAERCLVMPNTVVGDPNGSLDIALTMPVMTFTLQAQVGPREADPIVTTFNVTPPKVDGITGNPDAVAPNGPSQLSWTCSNGDHCNVAASDGSWTKSGLPLAGSVPVTVGAVDTSYTVTCVGAGDTSSTHTIRVPPPEATISVSGSVRTTHGRSTEGVTTFWSYNVAWTTTYANSCTVMCPDTGQVLSYDLNGSASNSGSNFGSSANCPRRFRVTAQGRGSASQDGAF